MPTTIRPFQPTAATATRAATTTTANVAIPGGPMGTGSVRVVVVGTDSVFLVFGDSTVTATVATGMPMLGNTVETFQIRNESTHLAAITGSGASTVYVTRGESA